VVGQDHRRLLPASALIGALFLLMAEHVARSLGSREIPIGILTAMIGTPAICNVFWQTRAKG